MGMAYFFGKFGRPRTRNWAFGRWTPRYSSEIYVLSLHGPQNAKLRDGFIDIKRLQRVDDDGLELWEPVFKAKFPLSREKIEVHLVHFSRGYETKRSWKTIMW